MGFLSGITSFVKEHSDVIHGVLDLAGFIPGVGAVADLANAAVYAVEGDYMNAALSVVSAVPGIGDTVALAKKSTKAIQGGVKAMKNMKALTKAEKMKGLFGLLRGKAQTGAKKLAGKAKDLKALFRDLKNGDKKLCLFGKCFTGDTLVYTKKGYVAIKEIRKGDDIYSRDADTGETGFKEVEEVFQTGAHTLYHIWLEGKEELKTTAYHPIYVEERGWVTAINLREGDPVQTMEGTACITKIEKERFEEPVPVYNLHVKDWVSYFVSYMRIFVHNGVEHSMGGSRALESGLDATDDVVETAKKTQKSVIESVENSADGSKALNNTQKGNYGEMKMDDYFESQDYQRISMDRVTDLNTPTHHGIDGVYYRPDGHPPYVIGEAKYGSSTLGNTRDGKQMSDTWINGSDRLVNSVGKDVADDILLEGYEKVVVHISPEGNITTKILD